MGGDKERQGEIGEDKPEELTTTERQSNKLRDQSRRKCIEGDQRQQLSLEETFETATVVKRRLKIQRSGIGVEAEIGKMRE